MTIDRLLPVSGAAFVALTAVSFAVLGGTTPGIDQSQAKIVAFYTEHHGAQTAAALVLAVAAGFLALFAAATWRRFTAPDGHSVWSTVYAVGGAVGAAGFLGACTLHLALSEGVNAGIAPAAAQALNTLDARDYLAFSAGIGIMLVGAAGLMIPLRGLRRVLGWVALVLGVAIFSPAGFIAFMLAGVWIVVVSLMLMVPDATPAPVPASA